MNPINVIPVRSPIVNHYIVTDGHAAVIIDTGMPGDYRKTIAALKTISPTVKVIAILITHADADHYGSVTDIRNFTEASTYASALEAAAIQIGQSSRTINPHGAQRFFYAFGKLIFRAKPGIITNTLVGGEILPYFGEIRVLSTPGHTPGHLSYYFPSIQSLFAGDSIWITANHPVPSTGANTWNKEMAVASFSDQMALNPKFIYAGHGIWQQE